MIKQIKVLIVDDSAIVRQSLSELLQTDPGIRVIGVAPDPIFAIQRMQLEKPDVITLDMEMPRMDGLSFLKKIMSQQPVPVIVISSFTPKDSHLAIRAFELGAVDVLLKPDLSNRQNFEKTRLDIIESIKVAASVKVSRKTVIPDMVVEPKHSADAILPKKVKPIPYTKTDIVIAIGASTGGTEAIRIFLEGMKENCPGIVIVQHMPELFTRSFAERLDQLCRITVKEAADGDKVSRGKALIARGNKHLILRKRVDEYFVEVVEGLPVNRHKPSVDVLFRSVSQCAGKNAVGILLTGMGNDGAEGLLEMKESGAHTIAQDEKSSIVFGMPKEAIKLNAANIILPLDQIPEYIADRYK